MIVNNYGENFIMRITKQQLRRIIKEEIQNKELDEGFFDRVKASAAGVKGNMAAKASELAGKAVSALGSETAASEMQKNAAGKRTAASEKTKSTLLKSHASNTQNAAASFEKTLNNLKYDIAKLGIKNPQIDRVINDLQADVQNSMNSLADFLNSGGEF